VRGEECFIGHVGDSRIYLRSNGKLNRITKDHSFVQTLVDSGVIDDEDAENHPNKNQILQALGIAPSVKATISQSPILPKAGDMFLLCSDGLNGMVNDRDMERIMQEDNLMVTSENLITAALNGGGHDNITASLVLIEESTHTSSRFVHFNPKPKVIDLTSTQQFGDVSTPSVPKKSKLPYFIGGGVLLLGASIAVMMMMGKEEVPKESEKLLTKEALTTYVCKNINDLKVKKKVGFDADTIVNSACDGVNHIFIIKDSIIVKVYSEKLKDPVEIENSDSNESKGTEPTSINASLNQMSESQIKQLKIGSEIDEKNGTQVIHNHKITIKSKKIDDIVILHKVLKNQGLESIVSMYKSRNNKLSGTVIAKYNQQHGSLTEDEKSNIMNEKHELTAGSILEIPLKGNQ
jgi:hypothetical protein